MQKAGIPHTIFPIKVSEIPDENLIVDERIIAIARQKAEAAFEELRRTQTEPFVVLSADTEVVWQDRLLGKPSDAEDATKTLLELSGREHSVKTAVVFIDSMTGERVSHIETTRVQFKTLDPNAVRDYVATGDPLDKAGSYGIQTAGPILVEKLDGPFDNVVGLPMEAVKRIIVEKKWILRPYAH